MRILIRRLLLVVSVLYGYGAIAQKKIIVAQDGSGNFRTIQEAINSLPDSSASERVIMIRNGEYHERLKIGKNKLRITGENRDRTVITGSISTTFYMAEYHDPYCGVVNLDGDDITITNLTIQNTFGKDAPDTVVYTFKDLRTGQNRTVKAGRTSHQFALRSSNSTRLKVVNCTILAWGADTVSPWDAKEGMYYFKDCTMQGGVDFYCPRGWSYAENCTFICQSPTAAIWHDGGADRSMKSVLKNCTFVGATPYKLGRYHHDSQFYLLNCTFDENMEDARIYEAFTAKPVFWGPREYYFNCHRTGGDFRWFADNLSQAPGAPEPAEITEKWTFDGKWNPLEN
jgi:pectinesterase